MKISEVKALTGLTKKALNYYEENGLIKPSVLEENGYRNYSDKDVEVLTQIATLRRFGLSVKEIKEALKSPEALLNVMAEYTKKLTKQINEMEKCKTVLSSCVNDLKSDNTDIKKVTEDMNILSKALEMNQKEREGFMIVEIERIFPGIYGKVLSFCFKSFLTEPMDSREKENAWMDLVKVLDNIPKLNIPKELMDSVDTDEKEWKTIQNRIEENLKNDNYANKAYNIKNTITFDISEEEQRQFELFCTYIKSEGNIEIIRKTLEAVDKSLSVLSSKYRKRKESHLKFQKKFQKKFKEEYFDKEPSRPLTIVHKETMSFVGIHYTKFINKKDFPKFIREFNNIAEEISNVVNRGRIYGFAGVDSLGKDIVPDSIFSFVFAVQVSNIEKVTHDMISFVLPQHEYLFYKHIGDMKNYQKSFDEVFMYKLEEKNYEMDILPSFQIFPSDIRDNDENLEVEMYFPVSKTKKYK